jgi:hypothetical protein
MHPEGFPAMVEGWSKGMASGAGGLPPFARGLMVAWIAGAASSVVLAARGGAALAGSARGDSPWFGADAAFGITAVAAYLAYAAQV